MAIQYKQLTELPLRTSFAKDDMLLVAATNATELGYITYKTTLGNLSSRIITDSQTLALQMNLITDVGQLNATDASEKGVAGNVVYDINSTLNTVKNNYVSKSLTTKQTIAGPLSCKTTPEITTCGIGDGNNKVVNIELMKSYVNSVLPSRPLFSTMFCKLDLSNRKFILTDVLPQVSKSTASDQKYTLIVKFKSTDNSTTKRTMSFTFDNNGTAISPTTISGWKDLQYTKANTSKKTPAVDHTWWHAKVKFTVAKNVDPNSVSWNIDNINNNVDISMSIFAGYV